MLIFNLIGNELTTWDREYLTPVTK
uniref:Uncharacterized protein n=1 Tax=Tetranychus urticae TaxID=32264 RepID=T1K6F5_TETUR